MKKIFVVLVAVFAIFAQDAFAQEKPKMTEEQKAAIIELLRRCSDDDKALDKLHNLVVENGGLEEASDVLKSYIARAMHLLHKYDDTPYRQSLLDLCTFIAERDR